MIRFSPFAYQSKQDYEVVFYFQFHLPSIVLKNLLFSYPQLPPYYRGKKSFQEVIPILPCKFCRSIHSCQIRRTPTFYAKQFYSPKSRDSYDVGVGCTAFGAVGHGWPRPFMSSPGDPGPRRKRERRATSTS